VLRSGRRSARRGPTGGAAPCPICGGPSARYLRARDLNHRISAEAFDYARCARCGTIFLESVPEQLGRYYPTEYYAFPRDRATLAAAVGGERYKIELVRRFVPGGRLLEIGPGTGGFAFLADEAGFDVDVLEMDERSARYLADVVGVRAIHDVATPGSVAPLGQYDVIALWHVIEHVPEPLPLLDALAEHLAPGGILLVAAPNPDAFQFGVFGRRWVHLDAPRHVYLLPIEVLRARAAARGLEMELATTDDPGGVAWDAFGWEHSVRHLIPRRAPRRVARGLARVLRRLAGGAERRPLRGTAYTLVFRRPDRS
jgi:2-polyprenyl-3-methyl-5-hydroxy-6-metoxy-1,4-benzoquinol methylase